MEDFHGVVHIDYVGRNILTAFFICTCQALESGDQKLYISSYGVADSTLEEVFLEVTENAIIAEEGNKSSYILVHFR